MSSSTTTATTTVAVFAVTAAAIGAGFVGASMVLPSLLKTPKKQDDEDKNNDEESTTALLLNISQQRRSIFPKQYSTKPVPRHIVEEMLESSRWAPTHKLTEPWEYIIYESIQSRKQLVRFLFFSVDV